jgi:hypothetical protein
VHETLPVNPLDPVSANVEVDESETVRHLVVVAQLLDLVFAQVQPEEGLWDEGVVKPLQTVVGHVQPLEVVLSVEEAVQVLEEVVVKAEGLEEIDIVQNYILEFMLTINISVKTLIDV